MNVTPNTPKFNRRALFGVATIPVLAGGIAVASGMKAALEDPHPVWLEQWRELSDEINATFPEAEDPIFAEQDRLERNIMTTPAQTPAGVAAQIRFGLEFDVCGGQLSGKFDGMDTTMFSGIAETLETLA